MKRFFKQKKLVIIAIVLTVIGIAIPFGLFFFSQIPALNLLTLQYNIFLWIIGVLYILIGFVWGDVKVARWRKKNLEWDSELPKEFKDQVSNVRLTLYLPALIVILVGIGFDIFYMIAGFYPFIPQI